MLILSYDEIQSHFGMRAAMDAIREALKHQAAGAILNPNRTCINMHDGQNSYLSMPSAMPSDGWAAVKIVSIFPGNPAVGKRTTQGVIVLSSTEDGSHQALLDASYLTALRTGAIAGVATEELAREDAETVGITGCGAMALQQLNAVLTARPNIKRVVLWNRNPEKTGEFADTFRREFPMFDVAFESVTDVHDAVRQADIVNVATRATSPVFSGSSLKAGTHINGVGSYLPTMQEVGVDTVKRADKIVVDTLSGCEEEAGDLIIPVNSGEWSWDQLHGELSHVVAGNIQARETAEEITFFKSVGAAYFDLAVASAVYRLAREKGFGTELSV